MSRPGLLSAGQGLLLVLPLCAMAWAYKLREVASVLPPSCEVSVFTAVYYERQATLCHAPNANCSVAF
eukprot:4206566-Pleurochrysis_carterae.AAC.1